MSLSVPNVGRLSHTQALSPRGVQVVLVGRRVWRREPGEGCSQLSDLVGGVQIGRQQLQLKIICGAIAARGSA
jgi:hypothetical protein